MPGTNYSPVIRDAFPWFVVVQDGDEMQAFPFETLKGARIFLKAFAISLANEAWGWPASEAENPSNEAVNEVLNHMAACDVFVTVRPRHMMPEDLGAIWQNPHHPHSKSTRILDSQFDAA